MIVVCVIGWSYWAIGRLGGYGSVGVAIGTLGWFGDCVGLWGASKRDNDGKLMVLRDDP